MNVHVHVQFTNGAKNFSRFHPQNTQNPEKSSAARAGMIDVGHCPQGVGGVTQILGSEKTQCRDGPCMRVLIASVTRALSVHEHVHVHVQFVHEVGDQ